MVLDIELGTWKKQLFSKFGYDVTEEKEKRALMIGYAIQDCLSVTSLYFAIYPPTPMIEIVQQTSTTTSNKKDADELSDASEDELNQILFPYFDKSTREDELNQILFPYFDKSTREDELNQILFPYFDKSTREDELNQILFPVFDKSIQSSSGKIDQQNTTTIETATEQMEERSTVEQQAFDKQSTEQRKSDKQKRKNEKYKWKKQNKPEFKNRIKRPIYHRYDYRKIRSQLLDDGIHTSHQTTIDRHRGEVQIGFKSAYEQEKARTIMRINYFSKEQYQKRWG